MFEVWKWHWISAIWLNGFKQYDISSWRYYQIIQTCKGVCEFIPILQAHVQCAWGHVYYNKSPLSVNGKKKKKTTLSPYCKRMNQDVFKPVLEQVILKNKLSSIMFNRSLFKTTTRKEINSMSCFKPVPYI